MERHRTVQKPFGHTEPFIYDLAQRHADAERTLVYWLGEWDVRMSDPRSDLHRLFAVNGMFHLQLWHQESNTSILTPSALTNHSFEAAPLFDGAFETRSYSELCAVIKAARQVEPPPTLLLGEIFFAMFNEFAWHIPGAVMPSVRFEDPVAAK